MDFDPRVRPASNRFVSSARQAAVSCPDIRLHFVAHRSELGQPDPTTSESPQFAFDLHLFSRVTVSSRFLNLRRPAILSDNVWRRHAIPDGSCRYTHMGRAMSGTVVRRPFHLSFGASTRLLPQRQRGTGNTARQLDFRFGGTRLALVGEAEAGKSTTAAALAIRGWPVLGRTSALSPTREDGIKCFLAIHVFAYGPIRVSFSLFVTRGFAPDSLRLGEKRFLPLDGSRARFASSPAPLAAIFLLAERSAQDSAPVIEPISQREALLRLVQNTYMNGLPRQTPARGRI